MGIAFGPIGAFLPELFDANVRYSGSGIGYNLAAIVGAAFVPTIATWLSKNFGVHSVGLYLAVMAVCCLIALATCKETKDVDLRSDGDGRYRPAAFELPKTTTINKNNHSIFGRGQPRRLQWY